MLERGRFRHQRQQEVLLWLWVHKHSPSLPPKQVFGRDLARHVAGFIYYDIVVRIPAATFRLEQRYEWELPPIQRQLDTIDTWCRQSVTRREFYRRTGKSTVLRSLINCIPPPLKVLFVCARTRIDMSCPFKTPNMLLPNEFSVYDFVFMEDIPNINPEWGLPMGKLLSVSTTIYY